MLSLEEVKIKSAAKINTLSEPLKTAANYLVEMAYKRGVYIIITEALRTIEYQNSLYAKGRDSTGKVINRSLVVTNARGGYSNHNFGYAFDFALLMQDGRTVKWDTLRDDDKDSLPDWSEVVIEAKKLGLEWGGDWRSFVDLPHLQMVFGLSTADYRAGKRPSKLQVTQAIDKMNAVYQTKAIVSPPEEVESIKYDFYISGEKKDIAFQNGSIIYAPLKTVAQFINAPFAWDNDKKIAYLNNKELSDFRNIDGRVYIQLRPIATSYGKQIEYDKVNRRTGMK
ncbi:M15 family metallopeptidase [Paenibacillus kandeliae]|uniref:M15 family metallopeptidase n=1 Tax=Paenibacillus kandeliae TaxID=3231269 RepID=UPI00345A9559